MKIGMRKTSDAYDRESPTKTAMLEMEDAVAAQRTEEWRREQNCPGCRDGWPIHHADGKPCHYEPERGNGPTEHFPCTNVVMNPNCDNVVERPRCEHKDLLPSGRCAACGVEVGPPKPPRPSGPRAYA